MSDKAPPVAVEIFGQTYAVKAGAEAGHVEALAALVDAKMKEVSRASGAVDSVRIAVLAALNIADDLMRARRELEEARGRVNRAEKTGDERVRLLAEELGAALGE
jgi:cell division protein ZapA